MASLDTSDGSASGRSSAEQIEADLKGSAEKSGEALVFADAAGKALGATTALSQASNSLIPQSAKHLSAAATAKTGTNTPRYKLQR